MENKQFFHLCANGAETRNYITCENDFYAAFNITGVCAANSDVTIVAFSHEESHPHHFIWGTLAACTRFRDMFDYQFTLYACHTRSNGADIHLDCEIYPIGNDEQYLRNVAVYTIIQPTKDGKPIMFYDYKWGTGSLYFRDRKLPPVWCYDNMGKYHSPVKFDSISAREKRAVLHSHNLTIPNDWLVCNGLILPNNYVDIQLFEQIYGTHNRYRVFTSSTRQREEEMLMSMASYRGVAMTDVEARKKCADLCEEIFGVRDSRKLSTSDRVRLAQLLRRTHNMTRRQIATVVHLPETEIRSYVA